LIATNAAKDDLEKTKQGFFKRKEILYFEDDLIIDLDSLIPDEKAIQDHEIKLKGIFGSDFN
jgi:hypothetical protein